ncbi:7-carboxy-7-deazaguanine synthase QueE [Pirellulaceae bacterium SH467]
MVRISEIFHSIQGEGKLSGTPSVFVRTSGCNLRCWFCDTRYASWEPEGDTLSVSSILDRIDGFSCQHVVITGGEPAIFDEIGEVVQGCKASGKHVTIETAGTVDRDWGCDLWSISPKLSNSTPIGMASDEWVRNHDLRRHAPHVVESLIQSSLNRQTDYQLKFVVGSILDAEEVLEYLGQLHAWDRDRVMMMPRGTTAEELQLHSTWLPSWCRSHGFRYCDRQHIYWFGNTRGT